MNIGLESSDEERLKKIAKGISTGQALQVLADCRELGILAKVFSLSAIRDKPIANAGRICNSSAGTGKSLTILQLRRD